MSLEHLVVPECKGVHTKHTQEHNPTMMRVWQRALTELSEAKAENIRAGK